MTQRELRSLVAKIRASEKRISSERDKLRDLISEVEGLAECCDRAVDSMNDAADALSEQL